jgi:hypothetical protein
MTSARIIRPTTSYLGTVLDMRVSTALGQELSDEINASVDHTQLFVQTTVPHILIVTQKQFASLNNYTEEMYATTDRLFRTRSGFIMEVHIDREVDTVDEIEQTIVDVEQLSKEDEDV